MGRHHDEPSDETPELDGETDPSTRTLAPTSMIELGETDDVNRSPKNEKNVTCVSLTKMLLKLLFKNPPKLLSILFILFLFLVTHKYDVNTII